MKKIFPTFVLLVMMVTACTPQAAPTEESVLPTEEVQQPEPTQVPVDLTPAQLAAISALADITGLPADKIKVVSTEAVTWSDGCLGVQREGMICTQALVEGFKIVLEADGREYEFHTNADGSSVVPAPGGQAAGEVDDSVIAQLAQNLGLDVKDISVVSSKDVEFGDACLGVAMPEIMCAQVVTLGKIIVLESNGIQYEYHTSADGSRVQPATLALTWKREGGFAGFCDSMTVFLSGEVYATNCKESDGRMETFASLFTAEELEQFNTWIVEFGPVELDASDPEGVADRMVVTLSFHGNGTGRLIASDEEDLFQWAQGIFARMSK